VAVLGVVARQRARRTSGDGDDGDLRRLALGARLEDEQLAVRRERRPLREAGDGDGAEGPRRRVERGDRPAVRGERDQITPRGDRGRPEGDVVRRGVRLPERGRRRRAVEHPHGEHGLLRELRFVGVRGLRLLLAVVLRLRARQELRVGVVAARRVQEQEAMIVEPRHAAEPAVLAIGVEQRDARVRGEDEQVARAARARAVPRGDELSAGRELRIDEAMRLVAPQHARRCAGSVDDGDDLRLAEEILDEDHTISIRARVAERVVPLPHDGRPRITPRGERAPFDRLELRDPSHRLAIGDEQRADVVRAREPAPRADAGELVVRRGRAQEGRLRIAALGGESLRARLLVGVVRLLRQLVHARREVDGRRELGALVRRALRGDLLDRGVRDHRPDDGVDHLIGDGRREQAPRLYRIGGARVGDDATHP